MTMTPATCNQLAAVSIDPSAISKVVDKIGDIARLYAEIDRLAWQAINDLNAEGMTLKEQDAVRECLRREFAQVRPATYIAAF